MTCLIPGPKKPPTEKINLYLDPLVDELKQLWAGQLFATIKYLARRMYYRALILVSCDTPAKNKISCKMMKIWTIKTELISKNQLINIQNIVNNSPPPANDILNYGAWYSYWCYAYERLNRQIASFYTSGRTVELDMFNYINQQIEIYELLYQIKPILTSIAQALNYLQKEQLSKETLAIYNYTIPKIIEFQYSITNINFFVTRSEDYPGKLIKPFSEAYLSNKNLKLLVNYYTEIYSNDNLKFYAEGQVSNNSDSYLVSKRIIRASALELGGEYFGSELIRSDL
ncbi:19854_t:CDS:2, partial [Dentiscutata erythropus]